MRDSRSYVIHYRIIGLNTLLTKLIKHYAMKAYGGNGCIDPHFLDLGTSWS
jgi:hypothetical protein